MESGSIIVWWVHLHTSRLMRHWMMRFWVSRCSVCGCNHLACAITSCQCKWISGGSCSAHRQHGFHSYGLRVGILQWFHPTYAYLQGYFTISRTYSFTMTISLFTETAWFSCLIDKKATSLEEASSETASKARIHTATWCDEQMWCCIQRLMTMHAS